MLSLKKVNSIIFETECARYMRDGMFCSQPILSLGKEGLVDVIFTYNADPINGSISQPLVIFGIYADQKKVAYIKDPADFEERAYPNAFDETLEDFAEMYQRYENLYCKMREWAFRPYDEEQAAEIREYCKLLKQFSGSGVWTLYHKVAPEFFSWSCQKK